MIDSAPVTVDDTRKFSLPNEGGFVFVNLSTGTVSFETMSGERQTLGEVPPLPNKEGLAAIDEAHRFEVGQLKAEIVNLRNASLNAEVALRTIAPLISPMRMLEAAPPQPPAPPPPPQK